MEEKETWKNAMPGTIYFWETDLRGQPRSKLVRGGQKFQITVSDRLANQDRAAGSSTDIFSNGRCVPVRLLDGSEGKEEFATNPNMIGDSDIEELLKKGANTVKARLKDISNILVLSRLLANAEKEDSEVSVATVKAIKARIEEVNPSSVVERTSTKESFSPSGGMKPVGI